VGAEDWGGLGVRVRAVAAAAAATRIFELGEGQISRGFLKREGLSYGFRIVVRCLPAAEEQACAAFSSSASGLLLPSLELKKNRNLAGLASCCRWLAGWLAGCVACPSKSAVPLGEPRLALARARSRMNE